MCGPPLLRFIPCHLLLVEVPAVAVNPLDLPTTVDPNLTSEHKRGNVNQYHYNYDATAANPNAAIKSIAANHDSHQGRRPNPLERKVESKHLAEIYNIVSIAVTIVDSVTLGILY